MYNYKTEYKNGNLIHYLYDNNVMIGKVIGNNSGIILDKELSHKELQIIFDWICENNDMINPYASGNKFTFYIPIDDGLKEVESFDTDPRKNKNKFRDLYKGV